MFYATVIFNKFTLLMDVSAMTYGNCMAALEMYNYTGYKNTHI